MFGVTLEELQDILQPEKYVGCAPQQTEAFVHDVVGPVLERYRNDVNEAVEINV